MPLISILADVAFWVSDCFSIIMTGLQSPLLNHKPPFTDFDPMFLNLNEPIFLGWSLHTQLQSLAEHDTGPSILTDYWT